MSYTRLLARAVIGGLFIGHGTQKLFGWFGGPGPQGTEQMMDKLEMEPRRAQALAAGMTETVSGSLLALGLATPAAAAGLTGVMLTAIRKVHFRNGPWNTNGGYEYNLVLIAALLTLADGGPGELSLDRALGIDRTGPEWALAALIAGAAGSAIAIEFGRRRAAREQAATGPGQEEQRKQRERAGQPA
ncbi:MAG: DoxX family protein [Actinobacteria bacterium]|nr:DoxX family protein [Actinomycetota bacterium]MBO0787006.1 DoxX family protein [Actinomycetota bacterium]